MGLVLLLNILLLLIPLGDALALNAIISISVVSFNISYIIPIFQVGTGPAKTCRLPPARQPLGPCMTPFVPALTSTPSLSPFAANHDGADVLPEGRVPSGVLFSRHRVDQLHLALLHDPHLLLPHPLPHQCQQHELCVRRAGGGLGYRIVVLDALCPAQVPWATQARRPLLIRLRRHT